MRMRDFVQMASARVWFQCHLGMFSSANRKHTGNRFCPPDVTARVAIEQASTFGWERYVGSTGRVIGMHTFGASAPLKALQKEFGFTVDNVVATVKELLQPAKAA